MVIFSPLGRVSVIAEAGVNHNGDISLAEEMIDAAALAGADFIKFQTFNTALLVSKKAPKADYQVKNTSSGVSQYEMLKKLELSKDEHKRLMVCCKKRNIGFLSSPFDTESIEMLFNLGLRIFKIPSGEITNMPYLEKIGSLNVVLIPSTGMTTLGEVAAALDILIKAGTSKENITVLHCNTEYPTPMKDVNLRAMLTIRDAFGVKVGYSDHTCGIEVPIAAVALGASVIEKHFTLDRSMKGPDHKASLEPSELMNMVSAIRNIEIALGDGKKKPSESEFKNIVIARKSIHLKEAMNAGEPITAENIIMKRPGDGISPMEMKKIIGLKVRKKLPVEHKLLFSDLIKKTD